MAKEKVAIAPNGERIVFNYEIYATDQNGKECQVGWCVDLDQFRKDNPGLKNMRHIPINTAR